MFYVMVNIEYEAGFITKRDRQYDVTKDFTRAERFLSLVGAKKVAHDYARQYEGTELSVQAHVIQVM